jgi:hypothetical protein
MIDEVGRGCPAAVTPRGVPATGPKVQSRPGRRLRTIPDPRATGRRARKAIGRAPAYDQCPIAPPAGAPIMVQMTERLLR